jgi:dihydroorotase
MIALQTCFMAVNSVVPRLTPSRIASLFSVNARNIFALPNRTIAEEQLAELTLFTTTGEQVFTTNDVKSKSENTPFVNKQFKGKVIGIYSKGSLILNK